VSRAELHCHLDGSVRPETIAALAAEQDLELPGPVSRLAVAPASCRSLVEYIGYIDVALLVLQTPLALRRAATELAEDWARDGVTHGELRFAPQLHQRLGLTMREALLAVAEGLRSHSISTAILLCCLRHQPPDVSEAVADLALSHRDLVAGLDLAGDESFPGSPHRAAFDAAHAAGLPVTIHAGEAAGPASMWEALDVLGTRRIGHGVRCVGDAALVERLARDRIVLEMCPTSNVQTGAVPSPAEHPIDNLLQRGLAVTVSTDARTVSATTVDAELALLRSTFGWSEVEEEQVQRNAWAGAF
jgi:adenosine deaminase